MSKRSLVGILIFLSLLFLASLVGLFIFKKNEQRAQIDFAQEVTSKVLKQIKELTDIGFAEQDEAVRALRSRAKRSEHKVNELRKQYNVFKRKKAVQNIDKQKLAQLIQLNKKMIRSYKQDMNEYQKLGLPKNNNVMRFTEDHSALLAIVLADLKKQQKAIANGELISIEHVKQIRQMIEMNKQSMDYYKMALIDYTQKGISNSTPNVHHAKMQLTEKARVIDALEKLLE